VDFKKLAAKAKKTIDDRGGIESLKADAEELKKVAKGKGSLTDKAKEAAKALKEPGARGGAKRHPHDPPPQPDPAPGPDKTRGPA
jgi:hypothetical protein